MFIATQLNWTQLNWTQLNWPGWTAFSQVSRVFVCDVTTYKLSQLLFTLSSWVEFSWVELCRYKHLLVTFILHSFLLKFLVFFLHRYDVFFYRLLLCPWFPRLCLLPAVYDTVNTWKHCDFVTLACRVGCDRRNMFELFSCHLQRFRSIPRDTDRCARTRTQVSKHLQ